MKYHGLDIKERPETKANRRKCTAGKMDTTLQHLPGGDFSQVRIVTVKTNPSIRLTSIVENHNVSLILGQNLNVSTSGYS